MNKLFIGAIVEKQAWLNYICPPKLLVCFTDGYRLGCLFLNHSFQRKKKCSILNDLLLFICAKLDFHSSTLSSQNWF